MDFNHLTTAEIREHIARLRRRMAQPTGIAYPLADYGQDCRELSALQRELHQREETAQ